MTYLQNKYFTVSSPGLDAGGRTRTSQLYTLGDYKQLGYEDTLLLNSDGTGSSSFVDNTQELSVGVGEYMILQSKQFHHYFSGKSQQVEITGFDLSPEVGVTKMFGYYSTSTAAPHALNHDGFWLQQDDAGLYLKIFNYGAQIASIPFVDWDGYEDLLGYDWSNFTVTMFDFLWLGGAVLRIFIKTDDGFVHAHSYTFAGNAAGTFTRFPNQPIRMEIRSTTGTGSMHYVCAQVSTEGIVNPVGKTIGVKSGVTRTTLSSIGTKYILCGVRKQTGDFRYNTAKLQNLYLNITTSDHAILEVHVNPVTSGVGAWTTMSNSPIEEVPAGGTVTTDGHIMLSVPVSNITTIDSSLLVQNFLTKLGTAIDGTNDEIYVVVTPVTNNISTLASMNIRYDGE